MFLRDIRKKKGLSQKEVSEKTEISQSLISRYETGERRLSEDSARALGKVYGIAWYRLMNGNKEDENDG